jgi:hypothetical protein
MKYVLFWYLSRGIFIWSGWNFAFKILEISFANPHLNLMDSPFKKGKWKGEKDDSPFEGWMKVRQIQFRRILYSIILKHKPYRSCLCRGSACVHRNRLVPLNIPVQYRPSNDHIWEIRQAFQNKKILISSQCINL